jgi:hypothetical protein
VHNGHAGQRYSALTRADAMASPSNQK